MRVGGSSAMTSGSGRGRLPAAAPLVLALVLASPAAEARKLLPRVAVFEIQTDRVKLKPGVLRVLRRYMADGLAAAGGFRLVPEDKMRRELMREVKRSRKSCFARSCQIRVGEALSADRALSLRVMKLGGRCVVTATMFHVKTQVSEGGGRASGRCTEAGLQASLDVILRKITGKGSSGSVPPPPAEPEESGGEEQALPPVKAEVGTLVVEGTPKGARVDVKGPLGFPGPKAAGLPYTWRSVPAGRYEVVVRKSKYGEYRSAVEVQTDRTRVVSVKLELSHGSLWVGGSPAGAKVEVSGAGGFYKKWGLTSGFTLKGVPRGAAVVKVSRRGYASLEQSVQVQGGQASRMSVKLKAVESRASESSRGGLSSGKAGLQWVLIPEGSFNMGATDGDIDEQPVHRVRVPSFELLRAEVTIAQYGACVNSGKCSPPGMGAHCDWGHSGRASHPVNCIDWHQARSFCTWAGGRLPSESEWEYAARSGGKPRKYPWGYESATCSRAVMAGEGGEGCGTGSTWATCSKPTGISEQGLCDLSGNVAEWVEDCYHGSYTRSPSDGSAWTTNCDDNRRLMRGGSWGSNASGLRAARRFKRPPSYQYCYVGFRCARTKR